MLRAVAERDERWIGAFIFAVSTTGVACQPGCPSRRAHPEHLHFFATLTEAQAAGYRPCRRCCPDGRPDPPWLPDLLHLVDRQPPRPLSDAALRQAGFDPVVVRRHFQRLQGCTFHQWLRARRLATAHRHLQGGAVLDEVILQSGWDSHSGFREAFARVIGTPPGQARHGELVTTRVIDSPVGPLVTAAIDAGVILLEFGEPARLDEQTASLHRWFPGPILVGEHPHLTQLGTELQEYFAGTRREFTVPLVLRGTPFELNVWQALQAIPWGETRSYADIARAIGRPKAVRAVGSANGRNRLAIVVPCHRVVNTGGALGGYGGGLWRKRRLLEIEQA